MMLGVLRFGILRTRGAGVRRTCEEERGTRESAGIKPALHGRGAIEEGFFPQRTRKGAAVLSARTSFGMTFIFWESKMRARGYKPWSTPRKGLPKRPRAGRWGQRHRSKDRPLLLLTQRVASRSGCATVEARRVVCVAGARAIGSQAAASGECAAVRRSRTRWVPSIVR